MKLLYHAFDRSGREVTDTIDAPSAAEAADQLRGRGLYVHDISPAEGEAAATGEPAGRMGGRSRRLQNLAMFTRQLYVLVRSGTPLAQALDALERQTASEAWRNVIVDVRARLENGASLSEAMEAHPECFDSVYRGMIVAGESSGNLAVMLERLAVLVHKRWRLRSSIIGAMIYPCLLVTVSLSVLTGLLIFVVPRFAELFASLDVPLPPTTRILISLSGLLRGYWWALLIALGALILGTRFYVKTPGGKRVLDTLVLRLPRVGRTVRNFATARLIRLLGVLLQSHLHVLEALRLSRGTVRNCHYADLLARAEAAVTRGQPISSAFADTDLVSPAVYEATASGEKSGQIGPLLLTLADFLDDENEISLKVLTGLIEPLTMIFMGIVVGLVAASMFLPLFDLTAMTGGGKL